MPTVAQRDDVTVLSETVVTPAPSHYELATTFATLISLNDLLATTLSDLPLLGVPLGPTDATWAFQWDFSIGSGGSAIISKDKSIRRVPEPGTLILFGFGLIGLAILGRRYRYRAKTA